MVKKKRSAKVHKKTSKKKAGKKVSRKKATKKKSKKAASGGTGWPPRPKLAKRAPTGYSREDGGLYLPSNNRIDGTPVAPSKIREGLSKAKKELERLMDELTDITEDYVVSEIELAVSFSADGKFLGVGVGGASTITVRFRPYQ